MKVIIFIIVVLLILAKSKFFKKKDHSDSDNWNHEMSGPVNRGDVDVKYSAPENLKLTTENGSVSDSEDEELSYDDTAYQGNEEEDKYSIEYLECLTGCECVMIAKIGSNLSSQEILDKYYFYLEQGKREGFTPVFIHDEESVIDSMKLEADASSAKTDEELRTTMEIYRNKLLSSDVADGRAFLEYQLENDIKKIPGKWDSFMNGQVEKRNEEYEEEYEEKDYLSLTSGIYNIVMVKVPVTEPWKIWAYLPYGSWNACPSPEEHMAVAKYWYETYGAIPAAITYECVDYLLPRPVDDPKKTAIEVYAYCGECFEQVYVNFASIGEDIKDRKIWNFWWD